MAISNNNLTVTVRESGNSLIITYPKQLATVQGINAGTKLKVEQEGMYGIRLTKE